MTTASSFRQLAAGLSHARAACKPSTLLAHIDPLLLARKGMLYLPCPQDTSPDILRSVVDSYYGDSSYDVAPSLAQALTMAYQQHPELAQRLPLAVVVQGSELYGVGTEHAALWLVHRDQARSLLSPWRDAQGNAWQLGRWRLMVNDTIILGHQSLPQHISAKRLHRLATQRRSADDLAIKLARATQPSRDAEYAVMVLRVPGFRPTDALGHQAEAPPSNANQPLHDSSRRSPIWTALLIAMVFVGAALAISRPALTKENALGMVAWMLTPMPTETLAPTATPTQPAELPPEYQTAVAQATELALERALPLGTRSALATDTPGGAQPSVESAQQPAASATPTPDPTRGEYPAPRMLYPGRDENVRPTYLTLQWEWDGELGEDEYFDVRLWIMGGEKRGIAWTKQPQYIKRASESGWHSWNVVVVRGRDGVVLEELSDEPAPVNFNWSVRGKEDVSPATVVPTQAQPTRNAPTGQPTRVPPGGD